jgi:diguanylate cyclase (GGDEF)-like protein
MFIFSASRNVLQAITIWGAASHSTESTFTPSECWALRRGRVHQSLTGGGAIRCSHLGRGARLLSLCTPLMAHGETLGVLSLTAESKETTGAPSAVFEFDAGRAASLAEQAALSFANLKLREKLRQQSVRDPLTGLFNRRYLEEFLETELPRASRNKRSIGVLMIDVDNFKKFNDLFGHDAGDTVLREFGDYLAKFTRRGDVACRYGGEEFVLILPESSLEDAQRRAEELRVSFEQLSIKHGDMVLGKVTLSAGVAAFPQHGSTSAALLTAADGALLRAKAAGRDRVLLAELAPDRLA